MHVEIPRPRDATELNNDGMINLDYVYYLTEKFFYQFFRKRFNHANSSFYSRILSAN